jgi:pyruvate dehydrogenase E2 component (dihydrolipoamide acetyltransferase)
MSATVTYEFRLPDPGEGLTEAEIDTWYVESGEEIAEDDRLCDVETDKALVEIPAPCTGTVTELVAEPGEVVAVGDVIAVFETDDPPERAPTEGSTPQDDPTLGPSTNGETDAGERAADESGGADGADRTATAEASSDERQSAHGARDGERTDDAEAGAETETAAETGTDSGDGDARVFAAPSTRRYAREQGVSLGAIESSGPNGRVLREDVDAHLESSDASEPSAGSIVSTDSTGATTAETAVQPSADDGAGAEAMATATGVAGSEGGSGGEDEREVRRPLRGLRGKIAENMVRSKRTIPHVTSGFECDAGELVALKDRLDATHDQRITYTPILVKAMIPGLKEFPTINASIDDDTDEIVEKRYYNVGVAVHTDAGLLVPVVENVDRKSIVEIAAELEELVEAARERTIDAADLQGGTFTVTNVGSHGGHGTFGTPIINHPQAAIVGVGAIEDKPVAVSESDFEVRKRLSLTLSYDHRIIDGVTAGGFAEHVIEGIEDPDVLLSRL